MPKQRQPPARKIDCRTEPPPDVSPRWLVTALALSIVAAALCGYAALCLLFYQGQWQLFFHPSRAITTTPASSGLAYEEIHFDVTDTGFPQLDGWWIPADPQSKYVRVTVLYLHDARGSLSGCIPALATLHSTGVNIFAFDYRGFGRSAGSHPSERLATDDSVAAWTYLTDTRHLPPRNIIVFGDGVGATFAARLAAQFAPAGAILEDPNPPARQVLLSDARARILPLWLLQNERFDPTADLAASHIPRLFLDRHGDSGPANTQAVGPAGSGSTRTHALFDASNYPKQYVDLRRSPDSAFTATLTRFYDDVLH
ncbi:MAG: alpha/beta fold hydrolase [Acidobacteriaceae bacterium]